LRSMVSGVKHTEVSYPLLVFESLLIHPNMYICYSTAEMLLMPCPLFLVKVGVYENCERDVLHAVGVIFHLFSY
jgi:hypothetical protein